SANHHVLICDRDMKLSAAVHTRPNELIEGPSVTARSAGFVGALFWAVCSTITSEPRDRRLGRALGQYEQRELGIRDPQASRVLALARELGSPPSGSGAGEYWRRFHARARTLHLVDGR